MKQIRRGYNIAMDVWGGPFNIQSYLLQFDGHRWFGLLKQLVDRLTDEDD